MISIGIWASKVLNDMFTKATEKDDDPSKIFLYSAVRLAQYNLLWL